MTLRPEDTQDFLANRGPEVGMTDLAIRRGVNIHPIDFEQYERWVNLKTHPKIAETVTKKSDDGAEWTVPLDIERFCIRRKTFCKRPLGECALTGTATLAVSEHLESVFVAVNLSCFDMPGSGLQDCILMEDSDAQFGNRAAEFVAEVITPLLDS